MNIQEELSNYLKWRQEQIEQEEYMFAFCKEYVQDKSIDVWIRFNFFAKYAIPRQHNWYIYHNKAMESIEFGTRSNLHSILYENCERYGTIDCVETIKCFIENFDLPYDVWDDEDWWIKIGEVWGDERNYLTYRGFRISLTKKQLESVLEQQMKDYVHTFVFDW